MRKLLAVVCIVIVAQQDESLHAQTSPWVTAYYAGWSQGWYNNGVLPVAGIDFDAVTHIIHFGLVPRADGTLNSDANSIRPTNSDSLIAQAHAAGKKVLICVGGWGTSGEFKSATGLLNRTLFITNLISFMRERGYDGIDIDWEPLDLADLVQYTAFITELRMLLDQITPRPLLTVATAWDAEIFTLIHDKLDQINLMTYDLSGAWPGWVTWHNSPIFNGGYSFPSTGRLVPSADGMIDKFVASGIPKSKLGIGIDFYGYVWSGGSGTSTGGVTEPRQTWSSPPQVKPNVPYYSLMQEQYNPQYYRWDSIAQASYLSIDNPGSENDKFITYDNEMSARMKMEYVKSKGIGGVIIWELGGGMLPGRYTNRDRLLQTVKTALTNSLKSLSPPDDIVFPVNHLQSVALRPSFQWKPSANTSWYRLQVAHDSLFTNPVIDQSWIIEPSYTSNSLSPDTSYFWRIQSSDAFSSSVWSKPFAFGTTPDPKLPPSWQYVANTGSNATVLVPSTLEPRIGRRVLRNGDLIGVFYRRDGALVCAGYSEWEQGNNTSITVWGDNTVTPVKDGCAEGDTLFFKFWERLLNIESDAIPEFSSGGRTYTTDGIYVLQTLTAAPDDAHLVPLKAGWNMISSYVNPNKTAIEAVTAPIASNLVLLKDNNGNIFMPDSGINTIGTWKYEEGYQVFMRAADSVIIKGNMVAPETTQISLTAGWNMIAYLRTSPMQTDSALASIQSSLLLVKDNEGNIFWPEYGIATLKQLNPGQGYKINVKENSSLMYPANSSLGTFAKTSETTGLKNISEQLEHFPSIKRTGSSAVLLLQSLEFDEGDEIGVYTEKNILVGSGKANENTCLIILWGKDSLIREPNGAADGEHLKLIIWKKLQNRESALSIASLQDGITGSSLTPTMRYISESVLVGTTIILPFEHYLDQNYPNPFNPSTTISYGISERVRVRLEIFDALGQRVAVLKNEMQEPGIYTVHFSATGRRSSIASGVYFCRLQAGTFTSTKKMLLVK